MKWDALCPEEKAYNFAEADQIVRFARDNGMSIRGHTLLWHRSVPGWAERLIHRTRDWMVVERHIQKTVYHFGGEVAEWDVVNEPIDDDGNGLRNSIFLSAFGPDYIDWAFWNAFTYAPEPRRFINEYGLEYSSEGPRRLAFLRLLEGLRRRGVPIQGVGLQAHLNLGKGPLDRRGIYGLLRDIENMGLAITVSELDVQEVDIRNEPAHRDMLVSDHVREYLELVLQFPAVEGVHTWGLSDRYSWLLEDVPGNRGLPYDDAWHPKEMRHILAEAMEQRATG